MQKRIVGMTYILWEEEREREKEKVKSHWQLFCSTEIGNANVTYSRAALSRDEHHSALSTSCLYCSCGDEVLPNYRPTICLYVRYFYTFFFKSVGSFIAKSFIRYIHVFSITLIVLYNVNFTCKQSHISYVFTCCFTCFHM